MTKYSLIRDKNSLEKTLTESLKRDVNLKALTGLGTLGFVFFKI